VNDTILVPLDGSAFGEYALPLALGIARRAPAPLQLVHVCTPPHAHGVGGLPTPAALPCERAHVYLTDLATCLSARWEVPISTAVLDGRAADQLYAHATAIGADLVVMTTHGYGPLSRMWMGSIADTLVRRLTMPVLLTRPHEQALDLLEEVHDQACTHVLIPLDGSALAEEILQPALTLGMPFDAKYTLIQAISVPVLGYAPAAQVVAVDEQILEQWRAMAQEYLDRLAQRLRGQGLQVDTRILIGPPAMTILDYVYDHNVDLVAMTTHGRSGVSRMLLGSVADKIVRGAGVPVLLGRPPADTADDHQ
jgi:nucleotide-binding universal stress UspA family protein